MITVRENQSIADMAIQYYGSIEGIVSIAELNGLGVTTELASQDVLVLSSPIRNDIVGFFGQKSINISTGEPEKRGDFNNDFNNDFSK